MREIVIQSRVRLTGQFSRLVDLVKTPFDPQVVLFSMWFASVTKGKATEQTSYQFGVGQAVVRVSTGLYYVEGLFLEPGTLTYCWRSTAFGEERTVQDTIAVLARNVLEKA